MISIAQFPFGLFGFDICTIDHSVISLPEEATWGLPKGGNVEFVMFEDVDGLEVFVNPEKVIWVREYPNQITVISCGHEDKFAVRLAPAHAVAALGKTVR